MDSVQDIGAEVVAQPDSSEGERVQAGAWLLELSLDWIILRASENVHRLLGKSHVTLIDEPLGRFVHSDALHDLRNLFSRLSATTGIARAYRVRLTDEPDLVDIAFQLAGGRILLEALPSAETFGERFGSIGGLIAGLSDNHGQALLDGAVRRLRALTGYDRVSLAWGELRAESSRGAWAAEAGTLPDLPALVTDAAGDTVPIFPRSGRPGSAGRALMRALRPDEREQLLAKGVRSLMRVPFTAAGKEGEFRCEGRGARDSSIELHAAAELFAQMYAFRLENDRLKGAQAK